MYKPLFGTYPILEKIMKDHYDQKLNLPEHKKYYTAEENKRRELKYLDEGRAETEHSLSKHVIKLDAQLKSEKDAILKITYPNTNNNGAIEINNALLEYNLNPKSVEDNIKKGLELNRSDYAYKLIDLYRYDKSHSRTESSQAESFTNDIYDKVGLTEKYKNVKMLSDELAEVSNQLDLITNDPDQFDKDVNRSVSVANRMNNVGQLSTETVFTN